MGRGGSSVCQQRHGGLGGTDKKAIPPCHPLPMVTFKTKKNPGCGVQHHR